MKYTEDQIRRAKKEYYYFMRYKPLSYFIEQHKYGLGIAYAKERYENHNRMVRNVQNGDKKTANFWKRFCLEEVYNEDEKIKASEEKIKANKEASQPIIAPIRAIKKLREYYKWLNTPGNEYRKECFSKKYTEKSVTAFLEYINNK